MLLTILTHLAYGDNAKKRVRSNDIVTVLKGRGKRSPSDVTCYCKMTSVVALDAVTSYLRLNDVTYSCKRMRHSPTIGGNGGKFEEAEDFKCVLVVYCVLKSK